MSADADNFESSFLIGFLGDSFFSTLTLTCSGSGDGEERGEEGVGDANEVILGDEDFLMGALRGMIDRNSRIENSLEELVERKREEEGEIGKSSTTSFFFFAINGRFLKIEKEYYGCKQS